MGREACALASGRKEKGAGRRGGREREGTVYKVYGVLAEVQYGTLDTTVSASLLPAFLICSTVCL